MDGQQTVNSLLSNCKRVVDDCVRLATTDGIKPDTVNSCIRRYEHYFVILKVSVAHCYIVVISAVKFRLSC